VTWFTANNFRELFTSAAPHGQDFGFLESNVLMPSSWHTGVIDASAGLAQVKFASSSWFHHVELMLGLPPGLKRTERRQCTNREEMCLMIVAHTRRTVGAQLYRRVNSIQIRIDHVPKYAGHSQIRELETLCTGFEQNQRRNVLVVLNQMDEIRRPRYLHHRRAIRKACMQNAASTREGKTKAPSSTHFAAI
jgi:hypothetical protein